MRELHISLDDLEPAFEEHSGMVTYYLDVETGEVVFVTDEVQGELERITSAYFDFETETIDWETAFEEEETSDWMRDAIREARQIEEGLESKFITIPPEPSHNAYRDMEDFIDTVHNERLQERLEYAIRGKGAFRRFKDVLLDFSSERERWFQFSKERLQERIIDWLDSEDIKLV